MTMQEIMRKQLGGVALEVGMEKAVSLIEFRGVLNDARRWRKPR